MVLILNFLSSDLMVAYACTYHSGFFDDDPCISSQSSESHHDMVVQNTDLLDGPLVLQLGHGLLFNAKNNNVFPANSNGCRTLLHGLLSIFDLKESWNLNRQSKRCHYGIFLCGCRVDNPRQRRNLILTWNKWPSGEKTVIARSYPAAIAMN